MAITYPGKKLLFRAALGVAAVAVLGGVLQATNVIHLFGKVPVHTASQYTKGERTQTNTPSPTQSQQATNSSSQMPPSDSQTKDQKYSTDSTTTSSPVTLLPPAGDFISNHSPNLSGSPAPNTETSVCNSTPGAKCQIIFTQGQTVRSLPPETADSGGTAYWNTWKLQDIGLTVGTWQVKAVATLNGRTNSTTDPRSLSIAQ